MTDNQIVNEKFLVYINDLLSTDYIADLCTQEDKDTFCNSVRGELKQAGMVDSADNCWDFFIDKVNSSPCRSSTLCEQVPGRILHLTSSTYAVCSSRVLCCITD